MTNRRNRPAQAHCVALPLPAAPLCGPCPPLLGVPGPLPLPLLLQTGEPEGLSLSGVAGPPGWSLGLG